MALDMEREDMRNKTKRMRESSVLLWPIDRNVARRAVVIRKKYILEMEGERNTKEAEQ